MKKTRPLSCYPVNLRITRQLFSWAITAMITLLSAQAFAQNVQIKGKVTDAVTGETLIGVTVKASSGSAVATDMNGTYTINADSKGTLTFSYTGYASNTVDINGQANISVKLSSANKQLTEVVVVGYGTQKRKDVTGSIVSVKLEGGPKADVPLVNALEAIQGTPGVNVGPSTAAGATPNIVIRGQSSITASLNPLIILDGVIFNGELNQINMNDIATFDILKDAASTAIYGSRAQNGVVSITTKRGKTDKPQINFNAYYGRQSWTRVPKMRQGQDYIQWRQDLAASKGSPTDLASVFAQYPYISRAIAAGQTMNWLEDVQQPAPIQNYDVSISGASERTNYYFSAGYLNQKGVLANDQFSKPNLTLKLENKITDWLTIGVNGYYSSRDYSGISADLYMATYLSPYSYKYVDGRPDLLQRYPEGLASNYNPYWGNPSNSTLGPVDDNLEKYNSIRGTAFALVKFPFLKGLSYRLNVNGERSNSTIANFHHERFEVNTLLPGDIANPTQFLPKTAGSKTVGAIRTYLMDNLLTYSNNFSGHQVDALVGYTRDNTITEEVAVNGNDFAAFGSTILGYYGLNNATTQRGRSTYSEFSNAAFISRLSYNYKSKYYAQVNLNRGAYSAFAPNKKVGYFPGASIAWVPTEEKFMKNVKWLNNLKVRASYGETGNQGIAPYATQATVASIASPNYPSPGYTVFGGVSYQYSFATQLGNQNLTWEKTAAVNLALDFALFNNRLSGTIDMYKSKTTDLLFTQNITIVNGYPTSLTNLGQINNKGIEVNLNSVNMKTASGFRWESGFAFWMNRNKLVRLTGIINPLTGLENDDTGNSLFIGKSLGAIYDYTFDGIVQTGDPYIAANTGVVPGDVKFKDINGDGKITAADRSVIGYGKENYNMNLSNTLTYKNFQLFFSINAIVGGGKDNFFISTNLRSLNPGAVQIGNWLNQPYWTPANGGNKYPRANYNNPLGYGFYQERTFARLQNVALSYLVPKKILDKVKISNLKFYLSGTNLFTATKWIGLDPANGAQIGGNGGSTNSSVNQSSPILRAFTFGLNAGF